MKHFFSVCLLLVVFQRGSCGRPVVDTRWSTLRNYCRAEESHSLADQGRRMVGQLCRKGHGCHAVPLQTDRSERPDGGDRFRGADGASDGCESVQS